MRRVFLTDSHTCESYRIVGDCVSFELERDGGGDARAVRLILVSRSENKAEEPSKAVVSTTGLQAFRVAVGPPEEISSSSSEVGDGPGRWKRSRKAKGMPLA